MLSAIRMTYLRALLVTSVACGCAALAACMSGGAVLVTTPGEGGVPAAEASADDAGSSSSSDGPVGAKNPYGVPYPTDRLGWTIRSGDTPGDAIENLTWPGYAPNGAGKNRDVQLADVYDPEGRTHDIVALLSMAIWNVYC